MTAAVPCWAPALTCSEELRMRIYPAVVVVGWLGLIAMAAAIAADGGPQIAAPADATLPAAATTRIVAAAQAFVASLDDAGRAKVQFPAGSPQQSKWSNLPTGIFPRQGIRLGDLTAPQRTAAMALLSVALSQDGYRKVVDIMGGDEALRRAAAARPAGAAAGARGPTFGEDEYYLAFIGPPSVTTPWMLQFGGHHLAINRTLTGAQATLAPSHTAAQPARYTFEGRTIRPLGDENDRAFALMATLDATQKAQAVLGYAVPDLVLGPGQD